MDEGACVSLAFFQSSLRDLPRDPTRMPSDESLGYFRTSLREEIPMARRLKLPVRMTSASRSESNRITRQEPSQLSVIVPIPVLIEVRLRVESPSREGIGIGENDLPGAVGRQRGNSFGYLLSLCSSNLSKCGSIVNTKQSSLIATAPITKSVRGSWCPLADS
jgi:hypothetical protein